MGTAHVDHGMVLGKFLPPHLGHMYLVEFARRICPDLSVIVGTLEREPIPGAQRVAWMRRLFPDLRVLHLDKELPQEPAEHPDFWRLWRAALLDVLPGPPACVFASEGYGARLAAELGARFVPVDPGRSCVPVSGTAIRSEPHRHWRYLPPCVRPWFARRVSVFGPESTGKTTLARRLAAHYGTVWVPEYARTWLEPRGGAVVPEDMPAIARGQAASEDALAEQCDRLLICDTDPLATAVWSERLFGTVDPEVTALAADRRYDLTLLLRPDLPWVADSVRYLPGEGEAFLDRCRAALHAAGRRVVEIGGDGDARLLAAMAAIEP